MIFGLSVFLGARAPGAIPNPAPQFHPQAAALAATTAAAQTRTLTFELYQDVSHRASRLSRMTVGTETQKNADRQPTTSSPRMPPSMNRTRNGIRDRGGSVRSVLSFPPPLVGRPDAPAAGGVSARRRCRGPGPRPCSRGPGPCGPRSRDPSAPGPRAARGPSGTVASCGRHPRSGSPCHRG